MMQFRPSDIDQIRENIENVIKVKKKFKELLISLNGKDAAELDCIAVLCGQLNYAGFWKIIHPNVFVQEMREDLTYAIFCKLCEGLNL